MIDNILKAMAMGEVKLTYKSLVSGKMKEVTGTLEGDKAIKQSSQSDKIIFWDVNNDKWEDIQCDTISSWFNLGAIKRSEN
jgi:uncharacterized lipoprotein YehR (DUF1307 family)